MTTRFFTFVMPTGVYSVIKIYRITFLCLSAKDIFQKNFKKSRALDKCPPFISPLSVPHGNITGLFTGPPINNQQKQFYSHRQIAAVFQL